MRRKGVEEREMKTPDSTQISESALFIRGGKWSFKTGLGSRKVFLLPKHVLRLKVHYGIGRISSELYVRYIAL